MKFFPAHLPILLCCLSFNASANDAAMNDGSTGPEPVGWRSGKESIIQMKSEHIQIDFGLNSSKVHAAFTFVSHKKSGPAVQKLGFPDYSRSEMDGDIVGPVRKLITKVNGKIVPSKLEEGYFYVVEKEDGSFHYDKREKPKPGDEGGARRFAWHVIQVSFPPGEEVIVERIYENDNGGNTSFESFFVYETRTGGAWHGKIEKLTAEVRIGDDVDLSLVQFTPKTGWKPSGDGKTHTLVWNNFEPRTDDNRTYFDVLTLDTRRFAQLNKDLPDEFPSKEKWIENWKKMHAERE